MVSSSRRKSGLANGNVSKKDKLSDFSKEYGNGTATVARYEILMFCDASVIPLFLLTSVRSLIILSVVSK